MLSGDGHQALSIIGQLRRVAPVIEAPMLLLESRAHLASGNVDEARRLFRSYLALRRAAKTQHRSESQPFTGDGLEVGP